jgi:hypothetical protein
VFPYVFHNCFFYFCAECHWNFDRDCVEHVECMVIFTMCFVLIHVLSYVCSCFSKSLWCIIRLFTWEVSLSFFSM